MEDFSFLPKSGIIFIDNCIFGTRLKPRFSPTQLERDRQRFENLQKTLSARDNWLTIPEVITEFLKCENYLYALKRKINKPKAGIKQKRISLKTTKILDLYSNTENYIREREKFAKTLQEEFRNATKNLTKNKPQRVEELIQYIEPIFLKNGGKQHKLNTDCKLIATTLTYAETNKPSKNNNIYLFSYDKPLLQTFVDITRNLDLILEQTYVIHGKSQITPCWKYDTSSNRGIVNIHKKEPTFPHHLS